MIKKQLGKLGPPSTDFIYGDFISLFELRVKAKSLIPARGRRTSNIEDVLGEDVIV